jgi:hypothetical protein
MTGYEAPSLYHHSEYPGPSCGRVLFLHGVDGGSISARRCLAPYLKSRGCSCYSSPTLLEALLGWP